MQLRDGTRLCRTSGDGQRGSNGRCRRASFAGRFVRTCALVAWVLAASTPVFALVWNSNPARARVGTTSASQRAEDRILSDTYGPAEPPYPLQPGPMRYGQTVRPWRNPRNGQNRPVTPIRPGLARECASTATLLGSLRSHGGKCGTPRLISIVSATVVQSANLHALHCAHG